MSCGPCWVIVLSPASDTDKNTEMAVLTLNKDFRKCWEKMVFWRPVQGKWHHYRKLIIQAIFPMVGCDISSYHVICVLLHPGLCHLRLLMNRPWPDIAKHRKQWHLVNQNYINIRILLILPPKKIKKKE